MPYKTRYGTHYHMTEGCCGAAEPCSAAGLAPCSICCGKGARQAAGGSPSTGGSAGTAAGAGDAAGFGVELAVEPESGSSAGEGRASAVAAAAGVPMTTAGACPAPPDMSGADISGIAEAGMSNGGSLPLPGEMERQMGYRSEALFGEGYTEAAPVMAHECFVLQNTDILTCLCDGILAGTEVARKLQHIVDVMYERVDDPEVSAFLDRCYDDQEECAEGTALFRDEVLPAIREATGHDIRHVLWLCDSPEDVVDAYGVIEDIGEEDIDEYETGVVLLADNGFEGKLWGYEHEIDRASFDMWW